jgi:signal transduction histidine kinase
VRTEVRNADGQRIGLVTVLRDISQAKQLEEQKARFIASASHELRTPIANIKTRLYLLRRRPDQIQQHIDIIESVVTWMQNLVEDMFDISRFERGVIALEREDITLQAFIDRVVEYQAPEAERLQINLQRHYPTTPITISADPYRLTQVVSNLLSNALHHTPQNGRVVVRLKQTGDHVHIRVEDSGAGIPEAHLPHLFQPFFRGDDSDNPQGAGLGLSIAQEIVQLHGGEITVESSPETGSTFIVRLPLVAPADDAPADRFIIG